METKVIEIDSTYRDRESSKHPADFRIDVNIPEKYSCLDSYDPVSDQAPLLYWQGNTLDSALPNVAVITGTVLAIEPYGHVLVSFVFDSLFITPHYYRGLLCTNDATILDYAYVRGGIGRFKTTGTFNTGDVFDIFHYPTLMPIGTVGTLVRLWVPSMYGCNAVIVYNETLHSSGDITSFTDSTVDVLITQPGWQYDHVFSLRVEAPTSHETILSATTYTVTVAGSSYIGDMVYIPKLQYYGKITTSTASTYTLSEPIPNPLLAVGTEMQTLTFSYDNGKSLRYLGTFNQQERTWQVSILDVQIPNQKIVNSRSLMDYSTLYLEFRDRNSAQDNIMTNNPHGINALFRLTADTSNSTKGFFTYSCPKLFKTFRFSPNRSYFYVRITTPDGQIVRFQEPDNAWPLPPKRHLQINVAMIVKML